MCIKVQNDYGTFPAHHEISIFLFKFGILPIYHRYTPCIPKVYRQYTDLD